VEVAVRRVVLAVVLLCAGSVGVPLGVEPAARAATVPPVAATCPELTTSPFGTTPTDAGPVELPLQPACRRFDLAAGQDVLLSVALADHPAVHWPPSARVVDAEGELVCTNAIPEAVLATFTCRGLGEGTYVVQAWPQNAGEADAAVAFGLHDLTETRGCVTLPRGLTTLTHTVSAGEVSCFQVDPVAGERFFLNRPRLDDDTYAYRLLDADGALVDDCSLLSLDLAVTCTPTSTGSRRLIGGPFLGHGAREETIGYFAPSDLRGCTRVGSEPVTVQTVRGRATCVSVPDLRFTHTTDVSVTTEGPTAAAAVLDVDPEVRAGGCDTGNVLLARSVVHCLGFYDYGQFFDAAQRTTHLVVTNEAAGPVRLERTDVPVDPYQATNTRLPFVRGDGVLTRTRHAIPTDLLQGTTGSWDGPGLPEYHFQWYLDRRPVPGATTRYLRVTHEHVGSDLRLLVVVVDQHRTVYPGYAFSDPVRVSTRPGRVPQVDADVRGRRVTVAWRAAPPNGAPVTSYKVRLDGRVVVLRGTRRSWSARALDAGRHRVTVVAQNRNGDSPGRTATFGVR
jgi:hypothetical protein